MTDRVSGLIVALDRDYREDDVGNIITAIRSIRGVANVTLHKADLTSDWIIRQQLRLEWEQALRKTIDGVLGPPP